MAPLLMRNSVSQTISDWVLRASEQRQEQWGGLRAHASRSCERPAAARSEIGPERTSIAMKHQGERESEKEIEGHGGTTVSLLNFGC